MSLPLHVLLLCLLLSQTLRELAKRVPGIRAFNVLVINFGRQPYNIPDNKRLRPGWQNLRDFIKIDHPDTQARVLIDNKLMDEVSEHLVHCLGPAAGV